MALVFGAVSAACGGASQNVRQTHPAPSWFGKKPSSPRTLYFVGSANAADEESTARELAIQKALSELTVYCGANITSDFSSTEVERNGELSQEVSLTVDVAGDEMTIRRAVVQETSVGQGSDGTWDAYALVAWPKSEYQSVLATQREKAERALELFLEAKAAAEKNRVSEAETKLREAKSILGPMRSQVPLPHDTYSNSAILYEEVANLDTRLEEQAQARKKVMMVAVECSENGEDARCAPRWEGTVKQRVSGTGFEVSADPLPGSVARQILQSSAPETDAAIRSAGFVLAVHYDANLLAMEDGFTFVRCGARAVVYDTDAHRIVHVKEVKPKKGGHVNFAGAMEKGCTAAEKKVVGWIDETLATMADN